jgi:integrase
VDNKPAREARPASVDRYRALIETHIVPALGLVMLGKLDAAAIETFYASLGDGGRRDGQEGGLAPATRRQIHKVLSSALARAVELRLITENPAALFSRELPRIEKAEMRVLDHDQMMQVLDKTRGGPLHGPVLLAIATGCRRGECLGARWHNIDLARGVMTVAESLQQRQGMPVSFRSPKGNKLRSVTLPAFAVSELRALKLAQAERLLRFGIRQDGDTLVCTQLEGQPILPTGLSRSFTRVIAKMPGMPRINYHGLRHSHATALLKAGVHPKVVQERLGHASIAITMDLYSHVDDEMQRAAAGKIDAAFGKDAVR